VTCNASKHIRLLFAGDIFHHCTSDAAYFLSQECTKIHDSHYKYEFFRGVVTAEKYEFFRGDKPPGYPAVGGVTAHASVPFPRRLKAGAPPLLLRWLQPCLKLKGPYINFNI